jgi:hypothetical protein
LLEPSGLRLSQKQKSCGRCSNTFHRWSTEQLLQYVLYKEMGPGALTSSAGGLQCSKMFLYSSLLCLFCFVAWLKGPFVFCFFLSAGVPIQGLMHAKHALWATFPAPPPLCFYTNYNTTTYSFLYLLIPPLIIDPGVFLHQHTEQIFIFQITTEHSIVCMCHPCHWWAFRLCLILSC